MMPSIMVLFGWGFYSRSSDQSPFLSLSSAPIQMFEIFNWIPSTRRAATSPTPARTLAKVPAPVSSSASSTVERVGFWVAAALVGLRGLVGGLSATVALGSDTVAAPPAASGALAVFRAMVGAPAPGRGVFAVLSAIVGAPIGELVVASLMVGAPTVGAPAVRSGIVGAGVGGFIAVGAPDGG